MLTPEKIKEGVLKEFKLKTPAGFERFYSDELREALYVKTLNESDLKLCYRIDEWTRVESAPHEIKTTTRGQYEQSMSPVAAGAVGYLALGPVGVLAGLFQWIFGNHDDDKVTFEIDRTKGRLKLQIVGTFETVDDSKPVKPYSKTPPTMKTLTAIKTTYIPDVDLLKYLHVYNYKDEKGKEIRCGGDHTCEATHNWTGVHSNAILSIAWEKPKVVVIKYEKTEDHNFGAPLSTLFVKNAATEEADIPAVTEASKELTERTKRQFSKSRGMLLDALMGNSQQLVDVVTSQRIAKAMEELNGIVELLRETTRLGFSGELETNDELRGAIYGSERIFDGDMYRSQLITARVKIMKDADALALGEATKTIQEMERRAAKVKQVYADLLKQMSEKDPAKRETTGLPLLDFAMKRLSLALELARSERPRKSPEEVRDRLRARIEELVQ